MKRRTLLQSLAALAALRPLAHVRLAGQARAELGEANLAALRAVAEVGLPSALDDVARGRVVAAFAAWHRDYRENADRGHGYGSGRLSVPTGPPPARRYPEQFAALDAAAAAAGAASFAAAAAATRRAIVERSLDEPRVANLPGSPNGNNLVADFLGFYFNSADAWDLCYQASIRRDSCRSLPGSDQPPPRLGAGGRAPSTDGRLP
jgi:hypothetical protein